MTNITTAQANYINDMAYRYDADFTRPAKTDEDFKEMHRAAAACRHLPYRCNGHPAPATSGLTGQALMEERATFIAAARAQLEADEVMIADRLGRVDELTKAEASELIAAMKRGI